MSSRLWLLSAVLFFDCVYAVTPRFSQELASGFAHDDMRKLVTDDAEIYYPAASRAEAERVAARASECLAHLRKNDTTQRPRERALLFITSTNYNNAYVTGLNGGEPMHSVIPLVMTDEIFNWYGLGTADTGDVACHEMFHYAHYEQNENFWRGVNAVVGNVVPTQVFLERWFTEGAAQFYEGRVRRQVGRPASPLYRAAFDSFVASRQGQLSGGDLTTGNRELNPFSGAYLTSLPFIEFLVARSGEAKLWELMDVQARSFFSPFGVSLRFQQVYGRDLGQLLAEFSDSLARSYSTRTRPQNQQVVRADIGQLARLASHPASGTLALVSQGNDEPSRLRIFNADGSVRVEKRLVRMDPGREWVFVGPGTMSGLSFSADGRFLYLLNDDLISRGDTRAQVWQLDAQTGDVLHVLQTDLTALGGTIAPDEQHYTLVKMTPGHSQLVNVDLQTGVETLVYDAPTGVTVAAPAWSPDGSYLAFSQFTHEGFDLMVRDAAGQLLPVMNDGQFNYAPHWVDNTRLVFTRTHENRLQAHRYRVDTHFLEVLTDAPFSVIDAAPVGDGVAFLNRDGTGWSLDRVSAPVGTQLAPGAPVVSERTPAPPMPAVVSDEPASPVEGLFIPQVRMPGFNAVITQSQFVPTLSLQVLGRDRLAKHTWSIAGDWSPTVGASTLAVEYLNQTLAPWSLSVSGSRSALASFDLKTSLYGAPTEATWLGSVEASRTFWVMPVSFGLQGLGLQNLPGGTQKFFGPTVSASWAAGESTAYAGSVRRVSLSASFAGYGRFFGSDFDMLDVAVGASVAVPLPISKRHSLVLSLRGRALPFAPDKSLKVGGPTSDVLVQSGSDTTEAGPGRFLPSGLRERIRGYEDTGVRGTAMAVANARYRYPFIIDRGFTSLLWLLPSVFFRQVDAELFGTMAVSDSTTTRLLRAAGAQVTLRTLWVGAVPVSLGYQFAWRFDLALPPLHSVLLTLD